MAMASGRAEHMAREAMRLDAHQDVFPIFDIPANQGDVCLLIENALEHEHPKIAMRRGERRLAGFLDKAFGAKPVSNEIGHRDDLHTMMLGEIG